MSHPAPLPPNPAPSNIPTIDPQTIHAIGVIGGGQLAWMMGQAATRLGLHLHVQTPEPTDPAVPLAQGVVFAPIADAQATQTLAQSCPVITFENEFVDLPALAPLQTQGIHFAPSLATLEPLLDKYHQRCYLRHIGLPTPDFVALGELPWEPGEPVPNPFGFPVVLKARRHGYDGRGTEIITTPEQLAATVARDGLEPFLLEAYVPFERELAVMVARSSQGDRVCYPVVETQQQNQVCVVVVAPAVVADSVAAQVQDYGRTLVDRLGAVGIFGLECFLTPQGEVLVNEVAPRTHNSGHYTLDACAVSQFEQHLRAVAGLPLGAGELVNCGGAVMVNLLGFEVAQGDYLDRRQRLSQIPRAHVYWYGKTQSRPGRKLGHVTVLLPDSPGSDGGEQVSAIVRQIQEIWR